MTIEEDKIARLTEELNRYKQKAKNRRIAIKDLQRSAKMWQEVALKYTAMHSAALKDYHEERNFSYYLAKTRAIEAGLVTESDCKHISGVEIVQNWCRARFNDYKLQNGIIKS